MSSLKEARKAARLTQQEAARRAGISLRSYVTYENDPQKKDTLKYRYLLQELEQAGVVDEEHGLLTVDDITSTCQKVFSQYPVDYCYLFGSYAKGTATETSDIDLLVSTTVTGLIFYGLAEALRETLHKKVDLLDTNQLSENKDLMDAVLKEGIKIYG